MLVVPARRDDLGPFYRDVTAVDPLEPWTGASAAYRLRMLENTLPFPSPRPGGWSCTAGQA